MRRPSRESGHCASRGGQTDLPCGCPRAEGARNCGDCPLKGLRVCVVGGLDRLLPSYRTVVGRLGAEAVFHNGHVKSGSSKLKNLICGADVVVFITSINSHSALKVAKAESKKTGKRFLPLRETGLEAFEKALVSRVADGGGGDARLPA